MHCSVSAFSAWTTCTKSGGTGAQKRSRSATTVTRHGGYACPYLEETRSCNAASCATDCGTNARSGRGTAFAMDTVQEGKGAPLKAAAAVQLALAAAAQRALDLPAGADMRTVEEFQRLVRAETGLREGEVVAWTQMMLCSAVHITDLPPRGDGGQGVGEWRVAPTIRAGDESWAGFPSPEVQQDLAPPVTVPGASA